MNQAPSARDSETPGQDNDAAPLFSGKRNIDRAHRLNFLRLSARYLGQQLTARQLHSLAGRINR